MPLDDTRKNGGGGEPNPCDPKRIRGVLALTKASFFEAAAKANACPSCATEALMKWATGEMVEILWSKGISEETAHNLMLGYMIEGIREHGWDPGTVRGNDKESG